MEMNEKDLRQIKSWLFVSGGVFTSILGVYFSKTGFGFEMPGQEWVGWGLGILCFIVQIAFSSQLAYRSYNYVIFLCGILAYIYSGWSNYAGIVGINSGVHPGFAILLAEFVDWIAEPLLVYGVLGVSDNAEGDFLRNLFGRRTTVDRMKQSIMPRPTVSYEGRVPSSGYPNVNIDRYPPSEKYTPLHRPVGRPSKKSSGE